MGDRDASPSYLGPIVSNVENLPAPSKRGTGRYNIGVWRLSGAFGAHLPLAIKRGDIAAGQDGHGSLQTFVAPIPPSYFEQAGDVGITKALSDDLGGIAADNGVGNAANTQPINNRIFIVSTPALARKPP